MTIQNISFTQTDISSVSTLLFDEKAVEIIAPEVEVRFGKSEVSSSGKPFFNTDVGEKRFNNIIGTIKQRKLYISYNSVNDTIYYKGRLRRIVSPDGSEIYQNKIKSSDKDIVIVPSFKQTISGIQKEEETIRISKSYEKQITKKDWDTSNESQNLSVSRERTSFKMDKYTLDLTVKRYSNGRTTFEVEAEFEVDFIDELVKKGKTSLPEFMVNIKYILNDIYTNIHSICSSSYFQPIQDKINSFNKRPAELRPKNISDEDVMETKMHRHYAVTNKLDGVGYNLIFVNQTVGKTTFIVPIAYNSVDIIRLASIKAENIVDKKDNILSSFSNVEIYFVEDTKTEFSIEIHFFDTLIYGTDLVYSKMLWNRLERSEEISDFCIKNFATPKLTFEVKKFFYNERDIIKNITNTISYMNDRYDTDLIKYNDGIIFQPLGSYYISKLGENPPIEHSILKWKFPSKVTIDFLLKEYSILKDGTLSYKLYSKTRPETFEVFRDQYTNTEHSIEINKDSYFDGIKGDNLNGKVVELGIEKGVWVIHRIRFDKGPEKVNHIKTANVTFVDMLYEFTLPYLIEIIQYANRDSYEKPEKRKLMDVKQKEYIEPIKQVETIKKQIFITKPKEALNADIKWLFPNTDKIKGQRITDLGLKSITRPKDAKIITDYITKKYYEMFKKDSKNAIITDAMAGNGGNTFNFSRDFKKVNAIEIDELTAEILEHNVKLYGIRNAVIFQDSFFNVINSISQNIIYIDPFTGERTGKEIIIDGKPLEDIVKDISPYTDMIVIKASKNANINGIIPNSVDDFTYYNLVTIIPSKKTETKEEEKGIPNLRKLANEIKKDYIKYSKDKVVLDIGSGVGGDLFKYEEVKPKELYFIEPSQSNIKDMEIRLNNSKQFLKHVKSNLKYLNVGGEETEEIVNFVNKKVDIINMFFSLTFFFKDNNTIESLANTIDSLLGPDGIFIGTTMVIPDIKDPIINDTFIVKRVNYENNLIGSEVIIDIKNTKTATYQKEYIVNLEYLKYILSTKGIYIEKEFNFDNTENKDQLTPDELLLNSMYYGFMFKRKSIGIALQTTIVPIKNDIGFVNELWYRSPSPGDGTCLFHSVMMTLLQEDYSQYQEENGLDIRDKLADSFTLSDFTKLQNGALSIILMHQMLQTKMTLNCFTNTSITEQEFKEKVDEIISKNSGITDIVKLENVFIEEMIKVGLEEVELREVFKGLYLISYLQYSSLIKDKSYWVDQSITLLLAEKLKINIIVISSNTMQVYKDAGEFNNDYLSVVIFNVDGVHFEPMFKNDKGNMKSVFTLEELKTIL
jgi:16S rRNA G966 N2-methylase RsmD/SAM-dependent methyltransferase